MKNKGTEAFGGIYSDSLAVIKNCIVWGNVSSEENSQIGPLRNFSHCAVEGIPLETDQNITLESENDGSLPKLYVRFQDPVEIAGCSGQGGDWRLRPNSPCIDRGDLVTNQPETDFYGNPRLQHNNVDLGIYESDVTTYSTKPTSFSGGIVL